MLPCTAGKWFLLSTDFLFAKNVFSQIMWWHTNKFLSFLKLIFRDFAHSLQSLSFPIQVRMWSFCWEAKSCYSAPCLVQWGLLLWCGAEWEWEFLHPNTSCSMCKTAVCEKRFNIFLLLKRNTSWIWRWLRFRKHSTEVL